MKRICLSLLKRFRQPVLVETFLPGREFTVGILGTGKEAETAGVMEVVYNEDSHKAYSYFNKIHYENQVKYVLVEGELGDACTELSLKVWRLLECRDAGRIDIRLDAAGVPNFIEINPLAGLNNPHSDLPIISSLSGIGFSRLIGKITDSAMKRYGMI